MTSFCGVFAIVMGIVAIALSFLTRIGDLQLLVFIVSLGLIATGVGLIGAARKRNVAAPRPT